ncbi:MAG: DUF2490 domain-containing protein [Bacteroidia bacterium]
MKQVRFIVFLLAFCFVGNVYAQTSDFGGWFTASLNKELNKRFTLGLTQEFRVRNNFSRVNLFYTNIGVDVKVTNFMKLSFVYRFIDKYKADDSWGIRHRFYIDAAFKEKPGRFSLSYRARMQWEFRGRGYGSEFGNVPEIYFRNLFKAGYKVNDQISPYLASEIRFQVQNPRIPYHNGFDRTRFIAGADYKVNSMHTFGAYFLFQKEWNTIDPETLYILGLEYTINID